MRSMEIEQITAKARAFHNGRDGFANEGKINVYRCAGKFLAGVDSEGGALKASRGPSCGHQMVTIDREPGVTPFISGGCPDCGGDMQSAGYRVPQTLTPTHEWYRPDSLDSLPPGTAAHVRKGGLILRPIPDRKAKADSPPKPREPHQHRDPDWQRYIGDISTVAMTGGNTPTIGVGADICDDCQTKRVLIACISSAGHECNVGVDPETAISIATDIAGRAQGLLVDHGPDLRVAKLDPETRELIARLESELDESQFDATCSALEAVLARQIKRQMGEHESPPARLFAGQMISRHIALLLACPDLLDDDQWLS